MTPAPTSTSVAVVTQTPSVAAPPVPVDTGVPPVARPPDLTWVAHRIGAVASELEACLRAARQGYRLVRWDDDARLELDVLLDRQDAELGAVVADLRRWAASLPRGSW